MPTTVVLFCSVLLLVPHKRTYVRWLELYKEDCSSAFASELDSLRETVVCEVCGLRDEKMDLVTKMQFQMLIAFFRVAQNFFFSN